MTDPFTCQILDLRSMDWSSRFTLGGFTVSYSSFRQGWEVIEKKGDYEVCFLGFLFKQNMRIISLDN